jgi:PAS domain-containing protein
MTNSTVTPLVQPGAFSDLLTEVLRSGAQRLLAHAVEAEVLGFIDAHAGERLEDGRARIVRVQQPRVRDRGADSTGDGSATDPALTALSGAIAALLRSTEKRMAEFAETGADWFWEMDDKFRFTYVSNNTGEIVGGDAAKILGQTKDVLLHGESDPDEWARHLAMIKARLPFKDFVYRRRSNTKVR